MSIQQKYETQVMPVAYKIDVTSILNYKTLIIPNRSIRPIANILTSIITSRVFLCGMMDMSRIVR